MGIKYLNAYLTDNCKSIKKVTVFDIAHKTVVIDASNCLYKFKCNYGLLENFYLLFHLFVKHEVTPIFIFDGQTPVKKYDILEKRREYKQQAEKIYEKTVMDGHASPKSLEKLKAQFVRVTTSETSFVKQLITAFGFKYITAKGESDQLCVYMVNTDKAYACISDDMDMMVYGCKRVLRFLDINTKSMRLYEMTAMLHELSMTQQEFRQVCVIASTEYDALSVEKSIFESMTLFKSYKQSLTINDFYEWLVSTKYITEDEHAMLETCFSMFELSYYAHEFSAYEKENINKYSYCNMNMEKIKEIMTNEGFIFT